MFSSHTASNSAPSGSLLRILRINSSITSLLLLLTRLLIVGLAAIVPNHNAATLRAPVDLVFNGVIALQMHAGYDMTIQFKDVKIKLEKR